MLRHDATNQVHAYMHKLDGVRIVGAQSFSILHSRLAIRAAKFLSFSRRVHGKCVGEFSAIQNFVRLAKNEGTTRDH